LGQALSYCGAGTVEFVLDEESGGFYFLEVNTRLQVEHPITELVIGHDLVHWQLKLAAGEPLSLTPGELRQTGHAIEVRICAEDPAAGFRPCTGEVLDYHEPDLLSVRYDSGLSSGSRVPVDYDSMLGKLIVWGHTRELAIQRLRSALAQTRILGLQTNLDFLQRLVATEAFATGSFHTRWIEEQLEQLLPQPLSPVQQHELAIVATLWAWQQREQDRKQWQAVPSGWRNSPGADQLSRVRLQDQELTVLYQALPAEGFACQVEDTHYRVRLAQAPSGQLCLEIDGLRRSYTLAQSGETLWIHQASLGTRSLGLLPRFEEAGSSESHGGYSASMTAKLLEVLVEAGQRVEQGQPLLVLESMKMESTLCAAENGTVTQILASPGEIVEAGATLLVIEPGEQGPA
ncbi:MAG: biotin/lipoyl-containing protein, partial [Candidatus Sericytochromatia bacterium]